MPSRAHFSQNVILKLLKQIKFKVEEELRSAYSIAITADGWTLRARDRYLTITAHYITDHWQITNNVLKTQPVFESHSSEHLSEIMTQARSDWRITRSDVPVPVTTDNAINVANAVAAAGFSPNIKCFAQDHNLMSRLFDKVRKVVIFFQRALQLMTNRKCCSYHYISLCRIG